MARSTHTQYYSNFVGLDASSDPRVVSRNRLAYAVNMWRDYESEQGAAVETFPGFRRVATALEGAIHGLYHFRSRSGTDYVVAHAGSALYAFDCKKLAKGDYEDSPEECRIYSQMQDVNSTAFLYNNQLHILDGNDYRIVSEIGSGNTVTVKVNDHGNYVPTVQYNGHPYEQRNMLTDEAYIRSDSTSLTLLREEEQIDSNDMLSYEYNDNSAFVINGFANGWRSTHISFFAVLQEVRFSWNNYDSKQIRKIQVMADKVVFEENAFGSGHYWLNEVDVYLPTHRIDRPNLILEAGALSAVINSVKINIYYTNVDSIPTDDVINTAGIPEKNIRKFIIEDPATEFAKGHYYTKTLPISEPVRSINTITRDSGDTLYYAYKDERTSINGQYTNIVNAVYLNNETTGLQYVNMEVSLVASYFKKVGDTLSFKDANPEYKGTSKDAIEKCTKCAIYDGRIFLTGNPALPNTVFYSQRNLTGANDPSYFGVYNYFNDGEGNTPNVDLLSTPSMLMVLKGNTVQDGSVYYHVGTSNTDEDTKNLMPRIYPSTQGAAGLGSAGDTMPSRLSCNFLDDPVFISKRGVESVGKEAINNERNIQHRSSNIDRLLIQEDLARASIAEWKKYLVICCNGHIYLADSRYMTQHTDGSYQYEWYYLEGVGTYEGYTPVWRYLDYMPVIEADGLEPVMLDEMMLVSGGSVGEEVRWRDDGAELARDAEVYEAKIYHPDNDGYTIDLYYTIEDGVKYIVEANGEEKKGIGEFFGATKILAVGERLIFGTDNGDICIFNTDMRGKPVGDRIVDHDKIDRSFYSFNGVAYLSGCSLKLDDCDAKSFSKTTVSGTTTARFKMMPGSHCTAMVTTNGRDWQRLGEAFSSRLDFADLEFSNLSFAENENNVVVFPEISRGWVNKQYYFYSDRFEAPFGLYELSYLWYVSGKIRY